MKEVQRHVCVYIFIGTFLILLLAIGCANRAETGTASTATDSRPVSGLSAGATVHEPLLSSTEADMVQFFQFLLKLDEGLKTVISQKQAEAMLPVVRKNVLDGAMGEEDKEVIVGLLRAEQKSSYSHWLERVRKRTDMGHPPVGHPQDLTEAEKQKWKDDWMTRTGANDDNTSPPAWEEREPSEGPAAGRPFPEDWSAVEKNVEQKLIELLEGKISL